MVRRNIVIGILLSAVLIGTALVLPYAGQAESRDIAVYFSRTDAPQAAIIQSLNGAQQSLHIAMYYFTDPELAKAVVQAHERGVATYVYLDRSQVSQQYSQARYLAQQGVPVRISSNPYIMHNKFAIIDGALVLTGSYNWTQSAYQRNDENLLCIYRDDIAQRYKNRFRYFWTQASSPQLTAAVRTQ